MRATSRRLETRRLGWYLMFSLSLLACSATERNKNMPLKAAIDVPSGQTDARTFNIVLRITNPTSDKVSILNPDMGVPSAAMNWPFSQSVYQASSLISFGYLTIRVSGETGEQVSQKNIQTWATPVLRPPLQLQPDESVELTIPIGDFYELEAGKTYRVSLEYGTNDRKVSASGAVIIG